MRVLLIDVNCKYSSTGKIVYELFQNLRKEGHEAAIAYGRGSLVDEKGIYKFGLDWETYIHAGLTRITGYNGCFSPISTKRLIRFIDEFKPDVIHIHELHAYFVNIKPLIEHIKAKRIKTVWTFHCEYMYTGKCGYAMDCIRYLNGCGNCPAVHEYPQSLFFDHTRKMLREKKQLLQDWDFTIVTPSQWLAERVKGTFLSEHSIQVIHNGIDTEIFQFRNADDIKQQYQLKGKKIILSVAPQIMNERKGGKTVLALSKQVQDKDICFVLVGTPETKFYSENVLQVQAIQNQVELSKWYSVADVFLICSTKENFPTTCIEAMCCGLPVVGIDEGGTRETVPAPYGLFVSSSNEHGNGNLLERLEACIQTQLRANFSNDEIRRLSKQLYSSEVMYNNYLQIYQHILN